MKLRETLRVVRGVISAAVNEELRANQEFKQAGSVFARLESNLRRKIDGPKVRIRNDISLLNRAITAGTTAVKTVGAEAIRQYNQILSNELVHDATSISTAAHVDAFTFRLNQLPFEMREAPLRSLALHIPAISNRAGRASAINAFWKGVTAPAAIPSNLKSRWRGLDVGATHTSAQYAVAGRAWRLSTPNQREAMIAAMAERGSPRSNTENHLAYEMHPDDLRIPDSMEFDVYADHLGFKTERGRNTLNQRLLLLSIDAGALNPKPVN